MKSPIYDRQKFMGTSTQNSLGWYGSRTGGRRLQSHEVSALNVSHATASGDIPRSERSESGLVVGPVAETGGQASNDPRYDKAVGTVAEAQVQASNDPEYHDGAIEANVGSLIRDANFDLFVTDETHTVDAAIATAPGANDPFDMCNDNPKDFLNELAETKGNIVRVALAEFGQVDEKMRAVNAAVFEVSKRSEPPNIAAPNPQRTARVGSAREAAAARRTNGLREIQYSLRDRQAHLLGLAYYGQEQDLALDRRNQRWGTSVESQMRVCNEARAAAEAENNARVQGQRPQAAQVAETHTGEEPKPVMVSQPDFE